MIKKCPVCGKAFDVLWPQLWRYKNGKSFICSWKCLRLIQKGDCKVKEMVVLTDDQKRAAAGIALNGENPLKYLKDCGVANPSCSWKTVLNWAKKNWSAEDYAELPESFGKKKPEKKEPEKKDPDIICRVDMEPLEVYAIKSRVLKDGFYKKTNSGEGMFLYGLSVQQEQIGLTAEHWKELAAEIILAMNQLGIKK